ncbi:MAG: ABC transporter ATP-binding protein [Promethearchaeota archaeon]
MSKISIQTREKAKNHIKMVYSYAWRSKKAFILTFIFMTFGTAFNMIMPRISGIAFNGISPTNPNPINFGKFAGLLLIGIGLSVIGAVILGYGRYFSAKLGTMAQYYLRKDIYNAINRQTFSFFSENETGDLVARATSDIESTQPVFNQGITMGLQSAIMIFGVSIAILIFNFHIGLIYSGISLLFVLMLIFASNKMRPLYLESRTTFGNLTTVFRENILGANVVRIFNAQKKEKGKFRKQNKDFKEFSIQAFKWATILKYSGWILMAIIIVVTLIYAALGVINKSLQIGDLVALLSYAGMLGMPIGMLSGVAMNFVRADAAMTRVLDVLESLPEIIEKPNAMRADNIKGDVEFNHVNFGYTSSLVLEDINFSVQAGTTIAMLGTTGSGKSTLISLLPRFYDPLNGTIKIDGIDVRDYSIKSLRKQIGICSQDIFLFNTSIADNIRYGKEDASLEEVIKAAKNANIHDFIDSLPEKYDTIVGERGLSLSGGQKQRIAIARALITNPKILILDDSTSAVDMETEYRIQQALEIVMKNRTTFIITQRISTIRNAQKIVVMDLGKIVGFGTHKELIGRNPLYTQIFETLYEKQKPELEIKESKNELKENKQSYQKLKEKK